MKYLLFIPLLLSAVSFAQENFSGKVYGNAEQTESVPFAKIYFVDLGITIQSDSTGFWSITDVAAGNIHAIVRANGFQTQHLDIDLQTDSTITIILTSLHHELDKVIVSNNGYLHRESITNVESHRVTDLNKIQNTTVGQAIANIPGVYQTGIGVGISKPVIRGLSGSSVVTYINGLRIENQQWGGDHGLPITSLGIGSVEVIKGPASLLFGADALGGVLYFVDEPYEERNKVSGFVSSRFEHNSLGTSNQAGLRFSKDKLRLNVYGGYDNFADYEIPGGQQVLNARFNQSSAKLSLGYSQKNWVIDLRYNFYRGRIGLPGHTHDSVPDLTSFLTNNQNRGENIPAMIITNHFLSVENKFFFKDQEVYVTLGNTNNGLDEHEEKFFFPDIIMKLNNTLYNVKWRSKISKKLETIVGSQGMYQINTNGEEAVELLIPDGRTLDAGVYALIKYKLEKYHFLGGARFDHRKINTTEDLFSGTFNGFNYAAGFARLDKRTTFRFNLSSGFRAPNTSELLSNGVHHGSFRYEIGNPLLRTEKAIQLDASYAVHLDDFEFVINPFYNQIRDYIYIQQTDSVINSFPVYTYTQASYAQLFGVDAGFHYHPHKAHWLHIESSFSNVFAEDENKSPLPLIPQSRVNTQVIVELDMHSKFQIETIVVQYQYFFKQNRLGILESETPGFHLLNASVNMVSDTKNPILFSVGVRNILNTTFVDHLSGLKNLGIPNPGINVYASIQYQFNHHLKKSIR